MVMIDENWVSDDALRVPLHDGGKETVIAGAKHGSGIHNTTNAWTAAVVQVGAKLKVDVRHDRLDADREHGAVDVRIECLGIV